MKFRESQHRSTLPLDKLVILFNHVVDILALTNLNALAVVAVVLVDRGCIRTTLVDIYQAGFTIPINRLG